MPLSKARNRKRMQELRAKIVQPTVQPTETSLKTTKQELQAMIHNIEAGIKLEVKEEFLPWYNPQRHKTGDKVKIYDASGQMQIVIVPELDADGHTIGE